MSVQASQRRFRIAPCGADPYADPVAGFVYPAVESLEVPGAVKRYPREFMVSDHDRFQGLLGELEASIKFETEMRGFGLAGPGAKNGVQAADGENGLLLKSAFGNQTKDTGNTVAGGTAAAPQATSATLLSIGNLVGFVDAATGLYHARQVRAKPGGDVLTLCRALPFAPANGADIYASAAYHHATQGHQHLWADAEGYDPTAGNNWRRYVRGFLLDLGLKLDGRARMEWSGKALDWSQQDGATQGAPAYAANLPAGGVIPGRWTRLWVDAAEQKVTEFGFDLGNDIQPKPYTGAKNGIGSWFVKDAKKTGKFTALHDDGGAALVTKWRQGTKFDLLWELTSGGPGNSFALAAPFVELIGCKEKSVNGLDAYEFDFQVTRNDSIAGVADVTLGVF